MTLLDEIVAAAERCSTPFSHPRLVNGQLLITSRESDALVEQYGPPKYPKLFNDQLFGIPVTVVPVDGTPKGLGSNKVAVCNEKISSTIYIFDYADEISIWSDE